METPETEDSQEKAIKSLIHCKETAIRTSFISALNEFATIKKFALPCYTSETVQGGFFRVTCSFNKLSAHGFGRSKKTAKSEAAKSVWNLLESTSKEFKNLPVNYEVSDKKMQCDSDSSNLSSKLISTNLDERKVSLKTVIIDPTLTSKSQTLSLRRPFGPYQCNNSVNLTQNCDIKYVATKDNNKISEKTNSIVSSANSSVSDELIDPEIKRYQRNEKEQINYVGMLQEYCQKLSQQNPLYVDSPVKGNKPIFLMTCSYQNHKVKVYRKTVKRCKRAAAIEMLVRLKVIPRPSRRISSKVSDEEDDEINCKPVQACLDQPKDQNTRVNYIKMLRDFCLKDTKQHPEYDHILKPGKLPIYIMTCSYKNFKVEASGPSLFKTRVAASKKMLVELKVIPAPDSATISNTPLTKQVRGTLPARESPKFKSSQLPMVNPDITAIAEILKTQKDSLKQDNKKSLNQNASKELKINKFIEKPVKIIQKEQKTSQKDLKVDQNDVKCEKALLNEPLVPQLYLTKKTNEEREILDEQQLEIEKVRIQLEKTCKEINLCCHRKFSKTSLNNWITVNRIQFNSPGFFDIEGNGRTLELSTLAANKATLNFLGQPVD